VTIRVLVGADFTFRTLYGRVDGEKE
jgi:hypothetical protein